MMDGRMSDRGRKMLIELEGSRSYAYKDQVGFLTIGVGHLLTKGELMSGKIGIGDEVVKYRDGLTEDHIGRLLQQDLEVYEAVVRQSVMPILTQSQFDVLVSFTFNTGPGEFRNNKWIGGFRGSTLLKRINVGRFSEVPEEMRRWIYAGGKTLDGLVKRREVEIERWNERGAT